LYSLPFGTFGIVVAMLSLLYSIDLAAARRGHHGFGGKRVAEG